VRRLRTGLEGVTAVTLNQMRATIIKNRDAKERELAEFTLKIDGMHCGSCVQRVSRALAATPGVTVKEVRVGAARVGADDEREIDSAIAAIAKAGYTAQVES